MNRNNLKSSKIINHFQAIATFMIAGSMLLLPLTACHDQTTNHNENTITATETSKISKQPPLQKIASVQTVTAVKSANEKAINAESNTEAEKPDTLQTNPKSNSIKPKVTPEDIQGTSLSIEEAQTIQSLQVAFAKKDINTIANYIDYPLSVGGALADIQTATEFEKRYQEILDEQLFIKVALSKFKDWDHVGSRGIMFDAGTIWLDGKIIAINYETDYQLKLRQQLKKKLHPSIQTFKENKVLFATESHIVRVDELANGENRYTSWKKGKQQSDKPDLVLTSGIIEAYGSQGGIGYIFNNGSYKYQVGIHHLTKTDDQKYSLTVFKGDESISKNYGKELKP